MTIKLSTQNKFKKAEAFDFAIELRKQILDDFSAQPGDEFTVKLTKENLDQLINYFAPSLSRKPKSSIEWVAKAAAGRDEIRMYLNCVHVKDGYAYATDGHRLHVCDTELENGCYDPKTLLEITPENGAISFINNQSFDGHKDNRLFTASDEKITVDVNELKIHTDDSGKWPHFKLDFNGEEFGVQTKYILESVHGTDSIIELVMSKNGNVVRGQHEFGSFLAMRFKT